MNKYRRKPCSVCATEYQPTTGSQWRCPDCAAANLRPGPIPLCGCGCGEEVNWKKGKWNTYLAGHHLRLNNPRKKGSIPWNKGGTSAQDYVCLQCGDEFSSRDPKAKFCSPDCYHISQRKPDWGDRPGFTGRTCSSCGKPYTATSGPQKRCHDCIQSGYRGTPTKCKCGCGEDVNWSDRNKRWSDYVHGHHIRVKNPNADGHVPWNKGNVTLYDFVCGECRHPFRNKLKDAKFCSRKCYETSISGENSHFWKGGVRTKYKFRRVKGKLTKIHRIVMANYIERPLTQLEVVHHIDEDGHNNNLPNLFLFHCDRCHQHHHRTKAPKYYSYGEVHSQV